MSKVFINDSSLSMTPSGTLGTIPSFLCQGYELLEGQSKSLLSGSSSKGKMLLINIGKKSNLMLVPRNVHDSVNYRNLRGGPSRDPTRVYS